MAAGFIFSWRPLNLILGDSLQSLGQVLEQMLNLFYCFHLVKKWVWVIAIPYKTLVLVCPHIANGPDYKCYDLDHQINLVWTTKNFLKTAKKIKLSFEL